MNIISTLVFLTSVIYVCLLFVVLSKPKRTKAYYRYVGFLIFGTLWVLVGGFETTSLRHSQEINIILSKLDFLFAALLAYFVVLFALHFPTENKKVNSWIEMLLFIPIAFILYLNISGQIFSYDISGGLTYNLANYYIYFGVLFVYLIVISLTRFLVKMKKSSGLLNLQLKYISLGYSITTVIGLFFSMVFAYYPHEGLYFGLANVVTLLFALTSFYVLFKYRLFDFSLAIKKGAIRLLSFIVIFGVYLFAILSLKESINLSSSSSQTTFLIVATLIVVVTIEPIRKLVHRAVDKIFESQDKKQEEARKRVYITLKSQQQYENLITSIRGILKDVYDVDNVEFLPADGAFLQEKKETYHYFRNTGRVLIPEELNYRLEEAERYFPLHKELKDTPYSALVSIGQAELFIGCFALGKRKNAKAYTVEEVRELKHLQDQFTEAMLNARLYQQAIARIKI